MGGVTIPLDGLCALRPQRALDYRPGLAKRHRLGSVGELAVADRRGNNSIRATSPIAVRTNPRSVKNSPRLLGLATMGRDGGSDIVGTSFCSPFLFSRFDSRDIEINQARRVANPVLLS